MVNWFLTKVPRSFNGKKKVFSTNGAGKTGYPHAKEVGPLPHIKCKSQFKMDQRSKF